MSRPAREAAEPGAPERSLKRKARLAGTAPERALAVIPPPGTDEEPLPRRHGEQAGLPVKAKSGRVPARRREALPAEPVTVDATPRIPPPVRPARPRRRHRMILLSFLLLVLAPVGAAAWYLWERAEDQYASTLGFTVRREEVPAPTDFLGGLAGMSSQGSSDTDVLYEFLQSQELVQLVDAELDLRGHYAAPVGTDPVFAFHPSGTIEDLVAYWRRIVKVSYDPGSGLIELQVRAFAPGMAQAIGGTILRESSRVINELSAIAREDALRYARADLDLAQEQLKTAREELTAFRSRTRIVDPGTDLQGQMGVLTNLQQQLAETLIELDILRETSTERDPRRTQAELKLGIIRNRIEEERDKFSADAAAGGEQDYATLVAEFERLTVEREFAEEAYTAALAGFAGARAEAERQSRYLAPFIRPTLAERAEYPQRLVLLGLAALFAGLAWAVLVLVYYSLKDRQ
nr:sugar transporter [Pseudoruegeria sp. HB172150]